MRTDHIEMRSSAFQQGQRKKQIDLWKDRYGTEPQESDQPTDTGDGSMEWPWRFSILQNPSQPINKTDGVTGKARKIQLLQIPIYSAQRAGPY